MIAVFEALGTVVSIHGDAVTGSAVEGICSGLDQLDARFSRYRHDSEVSRINRGEVHMLDSSAELRASYEAAHEWSRATLGAFTVHRPDGRIDLDGIVKAIAIQRVGEQLDTSPMARWTVTIGGDVLTDGGGSERIVGIVDPADRSSLLAGVAVTSPRRAIATSGTAERGDHIWRLPTGERGLDAFRQVTVVADDIVTADVLATGIVAGGREVLDHVCATHDIDVLTVGNDGSLLATPGIRRQLRAPAPLQTPVR